MERFRERDQGARREDAAGRSARRAEPDELRADVHNVEHHLAHVASAFFVSPFDEAAVLTLDGFGDFASTMLCHGRGNRLEVLDRVLFPHSLGIFYTAVTQWLGFPKYGDEGKVMGLAPYGDPEQFLDEMRELVRLDGDGFELELDLLRAPQGGRRHDVGRAARPRSAGSSPNRMEEPFGPAREPRSELTQAAPTTSPPRSSGCSRRRTCTSCAQRTGAPAPRISASPAASR